MLQHNCLQQLATTQLIILYINSLHDITHYISTGDNTTHYICILAATCCITTCYVTTLKSTILSTTNCHITTGHNTTLTS
jgi:hypothetical protein